MDKPIGPIPMEPKYPGIEFYPPEGTVHPDRTEDEALVKWRKIGDKYTIIEFEGVPVAKDKIPLTKDQVQGKKEERRALSAMDEIDMIAQIYPSNE